MNDEKDDVVSPGLVRPRVPSQLVRSLLQKTSMNYHSTRMHSLVSLSRLDMKKKDVAADIISAENCKKITFTVPSGM